MQLVSTSNALVDLNMCICYETQVLIFNLCLHLSGFEQHSLGSLVLKKTTLIEELRTSVLLTSNTGFQARNSHCKSSF